MVEYDRVKAQCRSDVNQNLLRNIQTDRSRLNSKLRLIEGVIEGARKVIAAKEQQIQAARDAAEALRRKLEALASQADELSHDEERWQKPA